MIFFPVNEEILHKNISYVQLNYYYNKTTVRILTHWYPWSCFLLLKGVQNHWNQ